MEQYLKVMRDAVEMMAGRMQPGPEESPQKLFNEYEHKFFESLGRIYAIRPDVRTRLFYTVRDPIKKDVGMVENLEMYFDELTLLQSLINDLQYAGGDWGLINDANYLIEMAKRDFNANNVNGVKTKIREICQIIKEIISGLDDHATREIKNQWGWYLDLING